MFQRGAGILLHITSLPSGDLGASAYSFVDKIADAGQKYWQILPLGQVGYGGSPYQCFSAFAGNVNLISNGDLAEAYEQFKHTDDKALADDFHRFCKENWFWLDDYSLFQALRNANEYRAWNEWDEPLRKRDPEAISRARKEHDDAIFAEKFNQYTFFRQWSKLKHYANEKGIQIIGDIPIYVAFDSADVWCNQSKFKLDEEGSPRLVAGVPPDYFSSTGQLWGNPVYDWAALKKEDFGWWVERIRANLNLYDIVRIDHFVGLRQAWEVPFGEPTAVNGEWADVPGHDLLATLKQHFPELPLIAEDLGEVTPDVEKLRDDFDLPGMRVLQFAFGGDASNEHLPHNHVPNSAVYTGTHDNETTVGWYKSGTKKGKQPQIIHCLKYLKSKGKEINWDMIDAAFRSVASIAIIPMQDVLGLDNSARMNTPATTDRNWSWRMTDEQLETADLERLRELAGFYAR